MNVDIYYQFVLFDISKMANVDIETARKMAESVKFKDMIVDYPKTTKSEPTRCWAREIIELCGS